MAINDYIYDKGLNDTKLATKNLIDIYNDDWQHIIEAELKDQFTANSYKKLKPLITKEFNIIKKVVQETALVYKKQAERTAVINERTDDEPAVIDENYNEIIANSNLDSTLKQVNKMTKLTNQSVLRTVWRDDKIDFDIYTFDNIEIFTEAEDWKKIIAVKYYINLELAEDRTTEVSDNFKADPYDIYNSGNESAGVSLDDAEQPEFTMMVLWTLEDKDTNGNYKSSKIRKYNQSSNSVVLISTEDNNYKDKNGNSILPFTLYTSSIPTSKLLDYTTGNDLFDGNINIAIGMIYLNELLKYQSYKQIYIKTKDADSLPSSFDMDAQTVLTILDEDGNADIGTLDIQTNIDKIWGVIRERIITILSTRGIPPSAIRLSGTPSSGISIRLDKQALLEMREDDLEIYRDYEKKVFDVVRIVNNEHNAKKISDDAKLKVDFAEISFPQSSEEKARADSINILNNVITPIDIIMRDNPDLTKEEAEQIFFTNKQINSSNLPSEVALTKTEQPKANG